MVVSEILRIKGTVLYTTRPDVLVLDAIRVMVQHDIGSLVVMDRGRMAGLITFAEVLKALTENDGVLGALQVSDVYDRAPPVRWSWPRRPAIAANCWSGWGSPSPRWRRRPTKPRCPARSRPRPRCAWPKSRRAASPGRGPTH